MALSLRRDPVVDRVHYNLYFPYWHLADNPVAPTVVRYWSNSDIATRRDGLMPTQSG